MAGSSSLKPLPQMLRETCGSSKFCKMILPLALHGVSEYEHKFCIEAQGYRNLLVTLVVLPGDEIRLDLPLTAGDTFNICGSHDKLSHHPGVSRPDVKAQHESIQGAYEITGQ
jgi:hypothetical protein